MIHAVYACKTYTICGVGHKTDTTLIDFVADMSCPTPTAAAQFASLDRKECTIGTIPTIYVTANGTNSCAETTTIIYAII